MSNGLLMSKSQFITPALPCWRGASRFGFGRLRSKVELRSPPGQRGSPYWPGCLGQLNRPLPVKQQNQKQLHPIGCRLPVRMLRFLRPEKFLFSLRGTSFFCSQRFLSLISLKSSSKPAWLRASFSFFCFSFPLFPGPWFCRSWGCRAASAERATSFFAFFEPS